MTPAPGVAPGAVRSLRIVHFSDTHLGHAQFAKTDASGLNQREQDHAAAFDAVIDHAISTGADLVIHAGDLFDGVRPSNRALRVAMRAFWRLSRAGIPLVAIAGNHEHPKLRDTGSPLALFTEIPAIHVAYQGRPETFTFQLAGQDLRVHAVPQMADNQSLGQAIGALPRGGPGLDILVVHGSVTTLQVFSHGEFNELSIDAAWLRGFSYVALGHHHGCTRVADNAWYCGAPERASMAESGQPKGCLEVAFTHDAPTRPAVTFREIAGRPYADLPIIDASGLEGPDILAAVRAAVSRCPPGAVVRQRVSNIDARLRGGLDLRSVQEAGRQLLNLDLSGWTWSDTTTDVRGESTFGPLGEEFQAFAALVPLPGVDRPRLLELARSVLEAP